MNDEELVEPLLEKIKKKLKEKKKIEKEQADTPITTPPRPNFPSSNFNDVPMPV